MHEDEYLDAAYEDRTCGPDMEEQDCEEREPTEEELAELDRDFLLEQQELEDFEGLNGPFEDYNDAGDW